MVCKAEIDHVCPTNPNKPTLPSGFRIVEEFPDYMVSKQATVKHIATGKFCFLVRVSATNGAMISVRRDGKTYTRAAQEFRDKAFG